MRKVVVCVLMFSLVGGGGCFGRFKRNNDPPAGPGRYRLEERADKMLDYMEGKLQVPPVFDAAHDPWKDTNFPQRQVEISRLKELGCLAENNKGRLELRKCDGLKGLGASNAAQRLLADENKDRKALYRHAAEKGMPDGTSVAFAERFFVLKRLNRAQSGQVFQLPREGHDFDTLKDSPLGKRLGSSCKPEAWVSIP